MSHDTPGPEPSIDTLAVHAGRPGPRVEGAVTFPIFQSATYAHSGEGVYDDVRYGRLSNTPGHDHLHAKLAALLGAEAALATSSGMAAIATTLMTLLEAGDHALVQSAVYGGTHALVGHDLPRMGIAVSRVPTTGPTAGPEAWARALRPETRVFYVEAIANPLTAVTDLTAVAAFSRAHGLVSVVDATFATPVNLHPLALGVDLEIHSATKYLSGHSDVIAGCVAGSAAHIRAITSRLNHLGGCLDAHAAFLLDRGLKTLALRVPRQNANALALAERAAAHPAVARVYYPGFGDVVIPPAMAPHLRGRGGVFSFEVRGGGEAAEGVVRRLRLMTHAPSLGGAETLVTRPATTSHAGMSPAERAATGVTDRLIRVACGIEGTDDLVRDLEVALAG